MLGNIIGSACVGIPLLGSELDHAGIIKQPQMVKILTTALDNLYNELIR